MKRRLSYTEVSTLLECQARHDFAYVGQLAGTALKRREPHIRLREGRAWGRAVAAFHSHSEGWPVRWRYAAALVALHESLREDAEQLVAIGLYDRQAHADLGIRLEEILWHYAHTTEPLALTNPELELLVPVPSRRGGRASSRYEFHAYLDGLTRLDGRLWIVEYKLRTKLTAAGHIAVGRQYRFYAWTAEKVLGEPIAGVLVDERLNELPKAPRTVKGKKKGEGLVPSHAVDQLTTPEAYRRLCAEYDVEPVEETAEALGRRKWQQREPVIFSRAEIAEVDEELRSAARQVQAFDSGQLYPLRNPDPRRCAGCPFKDICTRPRDHALVDSLYERRPPKHVPREEIAA